MNQQKILHLEGIKAVIFDMDGTMINNMPYHKKAWIEFCNRHGLSLTDQEFREKFSGKKNDWILRTVFGRQLTPAEVKNYTDEKEGIYQELYATAIQEIPGLTALINQLKQKGIALAIATTAPESNRKFALKALKLTEAFEKILGDEHVTHGKPNPEIYFKTAQSLKVEPSQCVVFEDTPVGVAAGKSAGMKVVGILTTHTAHELQEADLLISDFTQLEVR